MNYDDDQCTRMSTVEQGGTRLRVFDTSFLGRSGPRLFSGTSRAPARMLQERQVATIVRLLT